MDEQSKETIHLPISPMYVQHWGFWEAVRELIQNKVDTKSGTVDIDHHNLHITTTAGKLDRSTLLLGESSKRDDDDSIGCYGEGYKLAFLVLTRLGHKVSVNNYDEVWTVSIQEHPQLGVDCLAITIESAESNGCVQVVVEGLEGEETDKLFDNYLFSPSDYSSLGGCVNFIYDIVAEDSNSQILELNEEFYDDYGDAKKLFVGGLFVCDLSDDFKYSYNFAPNILELDRDRSSVSDFYLGLEVVRLLVRTGNIPLLIKMVDSNAPDVGDYGDIYSYEDSGVEGKTVGELSQEEFYATYGENAFPISTSFNNAKISAITDLCISLGLKPVTVSSLYYQMLPDSLKELPEMPESLNAQASKALEGFLKDHWKLLKSQSKRRLEKLITSYKIGGC